MPRRGRISKRDVLPDPLYNSKLVTKLINNVMYDGKKGVAQTIVYDAFKLGIVKELAPLEVKLCLRFVLGAKPHSKIRNLHLTLGELFDIYFKHLHG